MSIPNVYNALTQLDLKDDMREDFRSALVSTGYPEIFQQWLVPAPGGGIVQVQTAVALVLVSSFRRQLPVEEIKSFDQIIHNAGAAWNQLQKVNKASRVLTDYLR